MANPKLKYHLFVALACMLLISCNKTPLDWTESYDRYSKQPYGSATLYNQIENLSGNSSIDIMRKGLKRYLPDSTKAAVEITQFKDLESISLDSIEPANFLFFQRDFALSTEDIKALHLLIAKGSDVVIASNFFGENLMTTYGFDIAEVPGYDFDKKDTAFTNFSTETLLYQAGEDNFIEFAVREKVIKNCFRYYDESFSPILFDSAQLVLGIQTEIGEGTLTFCTTPKVFTNFQMLYMNHYLPEYLLQHIKNQPTYWGSHYFSYSIGYPISLEEKSIYDFVTEHRAVFWAFCLMIVMGLLYLLSNMRRFQKAFQPLPQKNNMTLDYIDSISSLYDAKGSHFEMLCKKIDLAFIELQRKKGINRLDSKDELAQTLKQKFKDVNPQTLEDISNSLMRPAQGPPLSQEYFMYHSSNINELLKLI